MKGGQNEFAWFLAFFVVFMAAMVGLGAYFYYQQQSRPAAAPIVENVLEILSQEFATGTEQLSPAADPAATSTLARSKTIDASDWQTYRSQDYGFEFKYPAGWDLNGNEIKSSDSSAYLAITQLENPKNLPFVDWWEENMIIGGRPAALYASVDTDIDGVKAKIAHMPEGESGWHIHFADSQNRVFSLIAEGNPDEKAIFDKILSTFNFIATLAKQENINDWKTYKNNDYNFKLITPVSFEESTSGKGVLEGINYNIVFGVVDLSRQSEWVKKNVMEPGGNFDAEYKAAAQEYLDAKSEKQILWAYKKMQNETLKDTDAYNSKLSDYRENIDYRFSNIGKFVSLELMSYGGNNPNEFLILNKNTIYRFWYGGQNFEKNSDQFKLIIQSFAL